MQWTTNRSKLILIIIKKIYFNLSIAKLPISRSYRSFSYTENYIDCKQHSNENSKRTQKSTSQDCTCIIFAIPAMTQQRQKRNRFYCLPASELASAISQSTSRGNSFARMHFSLYIFSILSMHILHIEPYKFPSRESWTSSLNETRRICRRIDVYDVFMPFLERFYYCAPEKEVFNSISRVS